MARGELDVEALSDALCSSAQLSEDMAGIDEGGGLQISCFSEVVDDATLHFQIICLSKQIYVWVGCNSAKFRHLYAAAPTRPNNAVSTSCVLGGVSDNTGSSIARHLVLKTGLPIMLACNIPKNSPIIEAAAEKILVHKLISLGYTKPKLQISASTKGFSVLYHIKTSFIFVVIVVCFIDRPDGWLKTKITSKIIWKKSNTNSIRNV